MVSCARMLHASRPSDNSREFSSLASEQQSVSLDLLAGEGLTSESGTRKLFDTGVLREET